MALTVIFSLSLISVLINTEPFKVAGIFLAICYLPGLCMLALFKRDKLLFEDFVLAFPCSVGLSTALILGFLFLGVQINIVPVIIHIITGTAIVFYLFARNKMNSYASVELDKNELYFSLFALLTTVLLSIPFFLGDHSISMPNHAFHHSSIVTQITNGIFPPENPGLGGTLIGYYWGFHAFIAALTVRSGLHQIQIMFILNMVSLFFILCISYRFAKAMDLSEMYRYILPLAVLGLTRSDAGILFLAKLLAGKLISIETMTASPTEPFFVLTSWISGLSWIDTRLFTLNKFYNISGMSLALTMCLAYLLVLLLILKKNFQVKRIYLVCITLIIAACFLNYPPLAIFLLIHGPVWICCVLILTRGGLRDRVRQALKIALPYIIAVLSVTPYILFITASRDVSSGGQGTIFSLDFYEQSFKNLVVFLPPLPLIAYGAWVVLKRPIFSKESLFLFIGTGLCLILTLFTRWPFDNSYKYNYVLMFFFGVFFVVALSDLFTFMAHRWAQRLIAAVIVVFLLLTPAVVELAYIVSAFSSESIVDFSGKHIVFPENAAYRQNKVGGDAYGWIRDHTPVDALIMLSYVETRWPCCGFNSNYYVPAMAERNLYAIKDEDYTVSNPQYAKRVLFREKLFANSEDPAVIAFFSKLNQPVYLLIDDGLDDAGLDKGIFFVDERFKVFPPNLAKEFVPVYQNDKQRVYHIRLNK